MNLGPVGRILHTLLQPVGIVSEFVLFEAFTRDSLAGTGIGHHKCKDSEYEEEEYQQEHDEQVDPEQDLVSTESSNHPGQRNKKNKYSDDYNRPLQKAHTNSIVLVC